MACETVSGNDCSADSSTIDTGTSNVEAGAVEDRGELGHAFPVAGSRLRHGAAVALNDVVAKVESQSETFQFCHGHGDEVIVG